MMKFEMKRFFVLFMLCIMLTPLTGMADMQQLQQEFLTPPASAAPQTWWHWVSGHVSKAGITADLQAMQQVGLGGVMMFSVDKAEPGPVTYASPQWHDLIEFALSECERLSLEATLHNCDGWSTSGGPWIQPQQAMQKIVWSETAVKDGQSFSGELPMPPVKYSLYQDYINDSMQKRFLDQPAPGKGYYQDIAVFALPASCSETACADLHPEVTTSEPDVRGDAAVDQDYNTAVVLPEPDAGHRPFLQFAFDQQQTFRSLSFAAQFVKYPDDMQLLVSDDGLTFNPVTTFQMPHFWSQFVPMRISFPPASGRVFRLIFGKMGSGRHIRITETRLSPRPYLNRWKAHAGFSYEYDLPETADRVFAGLDIANRSQIIDLTDRVKDGHLNWTPPPGDWTVLRMGHCPTGVKNFPATPAGRGFECDKLDADVVRHHFQSLTGKVIENANSTARQALDAVLIDSWEAFYQNWTPDMRAEFQTRMGYDPFPYFPTLTGYVVHSVEHTRRFLYDYRSVLSDLLIENHYGLFRKLAHEHGMQLIAEIGGGPGAVISDCFKAKAQTDVMMGEFWLGGNVHRGRFSNDVKETACAAHVYGRDRVAAESFTCGPHPYSSWRETPFDMKAMSDLHFCGGVNQIVFHTYTHQPGFDQFPGFTMGPHGVHFERTQTWWEQSKPWIDYLKRCQLMLRQGRFVADVCYYLGQGAPVKLKSRDQLQPLVPKGYDYDACSADVLLNRMSVRNGRIVLPDGMSYRILALRPSDSMSPAVIRKLEALVKAGATVLGPPPLRAPGLSGYPQNNQILRRIAERMWQNCDGKTVKQTACGRGTVIQGKSLNTVFSEIGLPPDFEYSSEKDVKLGYIHRRLGETEIYFVCNQHRSAQSAECTFRVQDKQPELWNPETGEIRRPVCYQQPGGRITIPLSFDPLGSVFVVFQNLNANHDPIVAVTRNDSSVRCATDLQTRAVDRDTQRWQIHTPGAYRCITASGKTCSVQVSEFPRELALHGPWEVQFSPQWGAPERVRFDSLTDWTHHPDQGIKYYSGTAVYTKTFSVPDSFLAPDRGVMLHLGRVREFADIYINGKSAGVTWKPPYQTDVSSWIKPGSNTLEIRVTNLWPNRLIGDARHPDARQYTWYSWPGRFYHPESPLLESGLLGPVRLKFSRMINVPSAP